MSTDTQSADVTIFHNPACKHSRGAVEILNDRAVDYDLIEYIVTPPSRETLEMIISKLINPVSELIRTTDKKFAELGLDPDAYQTPESVIGFLLEHPELMQRPIIIKGNKAIIARPSELISEVID